MRVLYPKEAICVRVGKRTAVALRRLAGETGLDMGDLVDMAVHALEGVSAGDIVVKYLEYAHEATRRGK